MSDVDTQVPLRMEGIVKDFPGVRALSGGDVSLIRSPLLPLERRSQLPDVLRPLRIALR